MKITFLALFAFATTLATSAAFGQTAPVISNQVQMVVMPENIRHAEQHALATERPLVGSNETYTYAHGERPLWEFGPTLPPPTPLGDVARAFRKEKQAGKKAEIVYEKQGS
jgi:hypothetical protein